MLSDFKILFSSFDGEMKTVFLFFLLVCRMNTSQIFVIETFCTKWIKLFCHNDSRCLKVFS